MYGTALALFTFATTRFVSDVAPRLRPSPADAGGPADFASCCLLLCLLLGASFAYTNYVTTARSTLFRGLHGGLRDIAFVVLSVPAVVWWSSLHEPGRLFPKPLSATVGGGRGTSFLETHVAPYTAGIGLCAGLFIGLHIIHLARGRFDGSMSGVDVAKVCIERRACVWSA